MPRAAEAAGEDEAGPGDLERSPRVAVRLDARAIVVGEVGAVRHEAVRLGELLAGGEQRRALRSAVRGQASAVPFVTSVSATIAGRSACSAASRTRSATSMARRLSSVRK